jgi:hypothetical protein
MDLQKVERQGRDTTMAMEPSSGQIPRPSTTRTSSELNRKTEESRRKKEDTQILSAGVLTKIANAEHDKNRKTESTTIRYQRLGCLWRSRRLAADTATPATRMQVDTMLQGLRLQHPQEARMAALCPFAHCKRKGQLPRRPDNRASRLKRHPGRMDPHPTELSSRLLLMDSKQRLLPGSLQVLVIIRSSRLPTRSSLSMLQRSNPPARRRTTTSRPRLHSRRRNRLRRLRRLA